eukprot:Nk52_evm43s2039 gene=Nk52_evmTU43s2039
MEKLKGSTRNIAQRISKAHTLTRRQSILSVAEGDSMKKAKNAAEAREAKRATLDDRHRYIFEILAGGFDVEKSFVEDQILWGDKLLMLNSFMEQGGPSKILFYYQSNVDDDAGGKSAVIFPTDGTNEGLKGRGCYFIKISPNSKAITTGNLGQELCFGVIGENTKIIGSLQEQLSMALLPALQAQGDWGQALAESNGSDVREFLESIEKFSATLLESVTNLNDNVELERPSIDISQMITPQDWIVTANNPEIVDSLEALVGDWCKQIEQVLAESEQMRKEADDIGPNAELEHWKVRMAKFNSITDQFKSQKCKTVVGILHAAKSRVLKTWKELDNRITDAANEAKDNVKYLYTLEKFCKPLYSNDIQDMKNAIPSLINVIKMIHSISRFYNTSERMTSLLVKITNQMINSCKEYIYRNGNDLWDTNRMTLIQSLDESCCLNEEYQKCFHETKKKLAKTEGARQFDFSEMYIFGKFDTFCKRLQKMKQMFHTVEKFSSLSTLSIEGTEPILSRFNSILSSMRRKPYDMLDHRKMEYDTDYEDFQKHIDEVEASLQAFIDQSFERIYSTERALDLLLKFAQIENLRLDLDDKFMRIFNHYGRDLEVTRKMYQKQKDEPPIPRNTPPVAGAISWARQLFRRIENPMKIFNTKADLMQTSEAKKITRNYNKLAGILVEFEMLWHRGWYRVVDAAKTGLAATVLVRCPDTGQLYVNFDPQIDQLIKETKSIQRMGLDIPPAAKTLCMNETKIKQTNQKLQNTLRDYDRIMAKVPGILKHIMKPQTDVVDELIEPGLTKLSWTSLNLDEYLKSISVALHRLEEFTDKANDIKECRIENGLKEISQTLLCDVPTADAWTVEEFMERTEELCSSVALHLRKKSEGVERAVKDLLNALTAGVNLEEDQEIAKMKEELHLYFSQQMFDSLTKCTRGSLDTIKRRLGNAPSSYTRNDTGKVASPFFKTMVVLTPPNISMQPGLDDIQQALNKAAVTILNVSKSVFMWGQDIKGPEDYENAKTYFNDVSSNKDVVKIVMMLTSTINQMKKEVGVHLESFTAFDEVWNSDKKAIMDAYLESNPVLADFENEIYKYEGVEHDINQIPEFFQIGWLILSAEHLKLALISETKGWKQLYGSNLNLKVKSDMEKLIKFMEDKTARLSRKVNDLDDVREAMAALTELRESEIEIDMSISPIEESYALLAKYNVLVNKEETERVDSIRYSWKKLKVQAVEVQDNLNALQPKFKSALLETVEGFGGETTAFVSNYEENGPMVSGIKPRVASERLSIFQIQFDELFRKWETCRGGEELFGMTVTEYPDLVRIKKELKLLNSLYGLYNNVIDGVAGYFDILWVEIDMEKINTELQDYNAKCRKLPKAMKEWDAYIELSQTINDFCETVPLLEMMSNKSMQGRHWDAISELTGHELKVDPEEFYLKTLMEAPLLKNKEEIEEICIGAVKEKDIESKLRTVVDDWSNQELSFGQFKNRGLLTLKGGETSEIIALMEDSLMVLGSLMSNQYNAPFKAEIQSWVQKLSQSSEVVENWLMVQNLWIYLEAVFVGGDIARQLPKEAKRFSNIDKSWVKIMTKANENPNVIQCCVVDETLGNLLPHLVEQLEVCQKSLSGYLEAKRAVFPRFYFVSDPSLLEVLGQASDSHTIQAHLKSVFDNVQTVKFHEKEYDKIIGMGSTEGEYVQMSKTVMAQGNVELWLGELLKAVQFTINDVIKESVVYLFSKPLSEFLDVFPAQIGLLGLQLMWTKDCEEALINARIDKKIMASTNQKCLEVLNALIVKTTQELTKMDRTKYETYITIQVHQRDVFDTLVKMHIRTPTDFEWLKQTRMYWKEEQDHTLVSITDVNFVYQNEYLGCTERLVITPLTDRCYITLSQALGMSLGGAPAGPAGTGKTETVKDMGRTLAKFVVVFNCSDQMDYRGLGKIYKGLAQSGCWGCFDEFNRIDLPVLSVCAQQVASVFNARRERKKTFIFTDGDTVELDPEVGMFITMNPGYAGRQELPENLKVLFRSVAMMVPDRQIIKRVKLASAGFQNNVVLARKFFVLYRLCEEQLSKQRHYDFGLRNILSVLRTAGFVKRSYPDDSENMIIMRVLRDMNLSKLTDEDEPLFLSLINDLFPGITVGKADYPELESAIESEVEKVKLICHPPWKLKLIQLYETAQVRHGIMVMGPAGAGKTNCIRTLMKAMTTCGNPHKEYRMNPKAITAPQMFGRLDVQTNDWTDGIFSALWRKTLKTKKTEYVWIVLDGPVDAIWIENLNTVLDDNKTLTLANGDRISMSSQCKLAFEVENLDNASPATVSRAGMIFMSQSALSWDPILGAWLFTRSPEEAAALKPLFEETFPGACQFLIENCKSKMNVLNSNQVTQACNILAGLIPSEESSKLSPNHIKKLYFFALMWSVGALLETEDRLKFQEHARSQGDKLDLPAIPADSEDTIYDFVVSDTGEWEHWKTRVPDWEYPATETPEYGKILIPTVDSVRTDFLINIISKQEKCVLLIGEPGTAKTVSIIGYLGKQNGEVMLSKKMNFSSATTPLIFQRSLESYVDKRMGTTFGPPAGKKMTIFIDDINMPVINDWGDQITNEIVRQQIEQKGIYSLEKPGEFVNIVDIQFLAAMIHPGGGRNDIPGRLKRHLTIFNCSLPSNASVDKIYSTIACGHYCEERGFSDEVREFMPQMVAITRKVWQATKVKMLPTPAKFHYIFNLRDLSRVWQGMIQVISETITTKVELVRLWRHELNRVISDRFTNEKDVQWLNKTMKDLIKEECGEDLAAELNTEAFFVKFLRDAVEPTGDEPDDFDFSRPSVYEPVADFPSLKERLESFQITYNEETRGSNMDMVFFQDALIHLVKISRVITMPSGSALLVGVGGSGKQSLTKLASYIAGHKIFQIVISRSYNYTNLTDDLKILFKTTGLEGKGLTFIFTDNEIKEEGFLEYINNILTSGEVSNLFARDEIDEICSDLRSSFKKEKKGEAETMENLYQFFIDRVRKNLHLVLCFSPVGDKFRSRAQKFLGLISGCTMDWFQKWPTEALSSVASKFLSNFEVQCTPEVKVALQEYMAFVHDFVAESCVDYYARFRRQTHVTPKSYLSFVNSYIKVYGEKKGFIGTLADRMDMGLQKLLEASESVAELQKELAVKEVDLKVASEKADIVLADVTANTAAAEKVKESVLKVKVKAEEIVNSIAADKLIVDKELEAAKPALEEASKALNVIQPSHIATVKKLAKPPHLIMRIMDGILLLRKMKVDPVTQDPERPCCKPSWNEGVRLIGKSDFMYSLQNFPKDGIDAESIELISPYLEMEDFSAANAKKVCGDVAGLASWVICMREYYSINKKVLPLKAQLAIAEVKLNAALSDLGIAQGKLDAKQAILDECKAKYDAAMKEKQDLQDDADSCKRKMTAATQLISGLAGEKTRWTQQSKEFAATIGRLVGDVAIACAFVSYAGPFNQQFRDILVQKWTKTLGKRGIPCSKDLDVIGMLVDPNDIGEWNLQGLPTDDLSTQNGMIVTQASRYSLLVDPQGQGKSWIMNKEGPNGLQVTNLNHKYFKNHLEDSLSHGKPLLIEDVEEELDPVLDNILEKNFIKSGKRYKVLVGDKEVDMDNGFILYLTTKLPNPQYTPEVSAKTSIIDFTVTMKGLEDQLLGRVILTEKMELEQERQKLLEDVNSNKKKMKDLEDNLLFRLTSTKGSLVDDESLIEVLQVTKRTAEEVNEKLSTAKETEVKINVAREEYRPVATRGSILYFLIAEMSLINPMYQTSLTQFLKLFDESMTLSDKSPVPSKRISNIIEYGTYSTFKYVGRGLYEEHKFLFTLQMALKIDLERKRVLPEEYEALIKGGAALDLNAVQKKPFAWLPDIAWLNLVAISKLPFFFDLLNQISRNEKGWKQWYDKDAPENAQIPDGYSNSLDSFKRSILVRAWCPDRAISSLTTYLSDSLGPEYAEGVILDMEAAWGETDNRTPLIGLLSMGSDPTATIEALSKKLKLEVRAISMGQGQEIHARRLLQNFMTSGGWVLLQNCHLGLPFMDELFLTVTQTESIHEDFRLWITTEAHPKFPINLLQISIKYTNDPPQGVKAGLKRTYQWVSQEMLEVTNLPQWKPMLYSLAFLHTVVQERRKFGPIGWNIPYEFNQADLAASVQFIQNHLDDIDPKKGISWVTVRYMICEVQYGGRVTDDFDRLLLNTYGKEWQGENIFADSFNFYKGYTIPKCTNIDEFRNYIENLPLVDTPEIFGLHPNADITFQTRKSSDMLATIMLLQPKDSGGSGGETREDTVMKMANEFLEKCPPEYLKHQVKAALTKLSIRAPLTIFLSQELDRMQKVIQNVRGTLKDLKLAIDGTIIMNEKLRDALDCLYDARIPAAWLAISWESSTLGFWFSDLVARAEQFTRWLFDGRPLTYWMTGLFNPQGFLTAMRQEVTRAHKGWALDTVKVYTEVQKQMKEDIEKVPAEGLYVYGFSLDGAAWDRKNSRLSEQAPKTIFYTLPVVYVSAVNDTSNSKDNRFYQCPVYKKPKRTAMNYIFNVDLRTVQPPEYWIMRGIALLCATQ